MQKHCARNFKIPECAFLIFEKVMSKYTALGILRFVSMLFLIFERGMSKKIAPRILIFVSMLLLMFEKMIRKKNCARNFKIRKYAFFNI